MNHQHDKHGGYEIRDAELVDVSINLGKACLPEPHDVDGDTGKYGKAAQRPCDFTPNLGNTQRLWIQFERISAVFEDFPYNPERAHGDNGIPEQLRDEHGKEEGGINPVARYSAFRQVILENKQNSRQSHVGFRHDGCANKPTNECVCDALDHVVQKDT